VDQPLCDRRGEHGTEAEATDGEAGDQAALVGEPLEQHRDRHDVGEAQAETADDAVAQDDQPQLVAVLGERGQHDAEGVDDPAGHRHGPRPPAVLDAAAEIAADEDHADRHRER
jgi:hypothetical protein